MNRNFRKVIISAVIVLIVGYVFLQNNHNFIQSYAEKMFYPNMVYAIKGENKLVLSDMLLKSISPFYRYVNEHQISTAEVEDELTYEMILMRQEEEEDVEIANQEVVLEEVQPVGTDISMEKLKDYNYLLSKFYTVDSTTSVDDQLLNAEKFLSKDVKIDTKTKGPKVLIFHTHSQEAFKDSAENDRKTSIVGIGEYLAKLLNEKGIETIHHTGVYDLIDGKLDRSKAYQMAEAGVKEILNQYPSIEVVIDLHRDGVPETTHLVTEIDGKKTAKIMFFNGLSRSRTNGNISYLPNPYIQDNLSFSFQMQLACEEAYPGFTRRIYLKAYRYSLHMMPKSLLVEAGAQNNTVEEVKNAMEILANVLGEVLL